MQLDSYYYLGEPSEIPLLMFWCDPITPL